MANVLTKLFGSRNQRLVRQYGKQVKQAAALEEKMQSLSDADFPALTNEFRERLTNGESLDTLLPEAFAAVREASVRTLGMRHFDVQLIGGMALHEGNIAEMRTGEGKTLVATLPAYLNALSGDGVHIVTVNDYLAQRDAEWMRPVYEFLGLTVGIIRSGQAREEKRAAYAADITYGTNNEYGFDYLRDNLAMHPDDQAQRVLNFAIVDEVDSILIDEARTPLIISGPSDEITELYIRINKLIPKLDRAESPKEGEDAAEELPGDYTVDEKSKQVYLTEAGHQHVEDLLAREGLLEEGESLYDAGNIRLMHHLTAALRAHALFRRDVEYVVNNGEIVIVDEFTGRTMPGRRWSDGLHQAVEAKEGVPVKEENQTVASITFQNYFRMYRSLSGMTGTADTEAFEFQQIYGLEVVVIPTHRPMVRDDRPDLVYLTQPDKFAAILEDIRDCMARAQPVLVGTTSIETSEILSSMLKKEGVEHEVLNAKQHEREAHIIVNAGRPGAVTIATNMAGRGTDIVLGGNLDAELKALDEDADEATREAARQAWEARHAEVLEAGGLHIIGTERHESRRIDNQLRGRSGRQGDPGSSRFYMSMEDNLMRIFGDPERTKKMLTRVGMQQGEAIESKLLTRQIERAQRKVEAYNFDVRKQLLEYDDVANDQRRVVYQQRNELIQAEDIADAISGIREEVVNSILDNYVPLGSHSEEWDIEGARKQFGEEFGWRLIGAELLLESSGDAGPAALREATVKALEEAYAEKEAKTGESVMRSFEKIIMLSQLDSHWKEHLAAMDYLRQGIHLRGYAQKNPKQEYKREAFEMFGQMLDNVKHDVISIVSRAQVQSESQLDKIEEQSQTEVTAAQHAQARSVLDSGEAQPPPAASVGRRMPAPRSAAAQPGPGGGDEQAAPFVREDRKVGRNEPCPCGSGKKYKHCHGRVS